MNASSRVPHKPAIVAVHLYAQKYAASGLDSLEFWDSLPDFDRIYCRTLVGCIEHARPEIQGKIKRKKK